MNRRSFFGTLAGAIVAQPVALHLSETMPVFHSRFASLSEPLGNIVQIQSLEADYAKLSRAIVAGLPISTAANENGLRTAFERIIVDRLQVKANEGLG